ncbi:NAD(P)-binding protein [Ophiobolus disseminans]|uniref:NAD(P)-binding protein n=1 Tax=Ophiobolus disseminans TaxID=1469910 RepID=A0A6A6ZHW2_9PLEO|nr:NAD(P)-binding protein [Ophiobolus disseminans]
MTPPAIQNSGLLLSTFEEPPKLVALPMPQAAAGTVVVTVLATFVAPNAQDIYGGKKGCRLPLPMTPGYGCIGRIHEIRPDTTKLKVGDLVYVDPFLQGRDDADVAILLGHAEGMRPEGRALMEKVWRNGALQKLLAAPLENCVHIDQDHLAGGTPYTPVELMTLLPYVVAAGPLIETANLQPGETVVIGPASGMYSGAAVEVALALGANVVALGRSEEKLAKMRETLGRSKRFQTVAMTGDIGADIAALQRVLPNGADVHSNWSPSGIKETLYVRTVSMALNQNARIVLSGQSETLTSLHPGLMVLKNILVTGKLMYSRSTVQGLMDLISLGLLDIGECAGAVVRTYGLEYFSDALETTEEHATWRHFTVVTPNV